MRILLIGPPGSGKGTQAALIQKRLGFPHISSGNMLREAVSEGTPQGKRADRYMSEGDLVPDDLVIEIIMERISLPDACKGFLLDGFPRTVPQAEALQDALSDGLANPDKRINYVLKIEVPDSEIIGRISGRRIDPVTDKIYHVTFSPPPPEIATRVIQRQDDSEEILRSRLGKYHADVAPLVEYYDRRKILHVIPGLGELSEVEARIRAVIEPS